MIHSTAVIDPSARLGRGVSVGPHSYVGPGVVLGDDCVVHSHVTITGNTTCGQANVFFPCAVIGMPPQDLKYRGERTCLEIGDDNVFREQVTVHPGTGLGGGVTRIGSHNRFLIGVHIAHDVLIGSHCILSNYAQLAGHVHLEDKVTMSGMVGVHHFATIGTLAFVSAMARLPWDVPPYMIVEGTPSARVRGYNRVGLRRWGLSEAQIRAIRDAYSLLFSRRAQRAGRPMVARLAMLEERPDCTPEVRYLCAFIRRGMRDGVDGRQLEAQRRDSDEDRSHYYQAEKGGI